MKSVGYSIVDYFFKQVGMIPDHFRIYFQISVKKIEIVELNLTQHSLTRCVVNVHNLKILLNCKAISSSSTLSALRVTATSLNFLLQTSPDLPSFPAQMGVGLMPSSVTIFSASKYANLPNTSVWA